MSGKQINDDYGPDMVKEGVHLDVDSFEEGSIFCWEDYNGTKTEIFAPAKEVHKIIKLVGEFLQLKGFNCRVETTFNNNKKGGNDGE